jgi:hypothetical protein
LAEPESRKPDVLPVQSHLSTTTPPPPSNRPTPQDGHAERHVGTTRGNPATANDVTTTCLCARCGLADDGRCMAGRQGVAQPSRHRVGKQGRACKRQKSVLEQRHIYSQPYIHNRSVVCEQKQKHGICAGRTRCDVLRLRCAFCAQHMRERGHTATRCDAACAVYIYKHTNCICIKYNGAHTIISSCGLPTIHTYNATRRATRTHATTASTTRTTQRAPQRT